MALRSPARGGRLFVLTLALWGLFAPGQMAQAEPIDLLVNGSFAASGGGWQGVSESTTCNGGIPSLGAWDADGLYFSYEQGTVTQDVVVPEPSFITLDFSGAIGEGGGEYEGSLSDNNEQVSTGLIVDPTNTGYSLSIETTSPDEIVSVSFTGVDGLWWEGCYGPVITAASLNAEPVAPPTTSTTTTQPVPANSPGVQYVTWASAGGSPAEPTSVDIPLTQGVVNSISFDWGGGLVMDTNRVDGVIIRFSGFIQPTSPGAYDFYLCSDDGMRLYIDGQLMIDNWWDRGPSCGAPATIDFSNGQAKSLVVFWYENGGGAMLDLRYASVSNPQMANVPASWYSYGSEVPPPASTTTTTQPPAPPSLGMPTGVNVSATENGVLLEWGAAADNVNISPERYAITWSNGSSGWGISTGNVGDPNALNTSITIPYELFSSTGGLNVTYYFTVRADNDSSGIYSPQSQAVELFVSAPAPQTTTTTTTTTTIPVPPTIDDGSGNSDDGGTDEQPVDSGPEEPPVDDEPTPSTPDENAIPEPAPDGENEEPSEETPIEEPATDNPVEEPATGDPTEPVEPVIPEEPVAPEDPAVLEPEVLEELAPEEVEQLVEELVSDGLDAEEAAALATSGNVLASISGDEASEIFESLDVNGLSEEEKQEVVDAVQDAPDDVREAFEEEVNVFGGGAFDNYTPLGSVITVGERRVVIAGTAVILAGVPIPTGSSAPSQSSSQSTSGGSSESSNRRRRVR